MDLERSKTQMRKGILELCILSLLNKSEMYTSTIIEELKAKDMIVVEGTLYPLLSRLKNAGLLNYRWEESSGGPPRKYFSLTKEGEIALKELKGAWEDLNRKVNQIIEK